MRTEAAFDGHRTHATRLLNSPQSLSRPRVPIMVGGGGEKKTLRLVARFADACNVFGSPETIARKYAILDAHCADVGRDSAEIERTTLQSVRLSPDGSTSSAHVIDHFGDLADAGAEHIIFSVRDIHDPAIMEILGRDVLPAVKAIHRPKPAF